MPRTLLYRLLAGGLMLVLGGAALASSHSEAPGTAKDRFGDDTDLYAWVAADAPDAVTLVGNWAPLLEPNGGPNFYAFDDEATYWINVDNVGDALDHVRFQFRFRTERRSGATFLYNTGVVTTLDDPDLNVRQFVTVTRYDDGVPTVLGAELPVAPNFVGPASMPDYAALAMQAVHVLPDGSKLFVGPRDDPFFVDLGAVFDLLTIRKPPGDKGKGVDGLAGYDVLSVVLQVPKSRLTRDRQAAGPANGVIGIYNSVERPATRTLNGDGTVSTSGAAVQVSRLGMPLVNEVVIGLADKDRFNATKPTGDGAFLRYVTHPHLADLLGLIHGIAAPPPPRSDLVTVFLTGIPGLNRPDNPSQVPCEMLRLNMTIAPAASPSRFGVLGGDIAGFPNGRRPSDDVVDIAERVVAGATPFTPAFDVAPNNQLGDGVDFNDRPFLPYFPYLALPHDPLAAPRPGLTSREMVSSDLRGDTSRSIESRPGLGLRLAGPNPARVARLEFSVPSAGRVQLRVFDLAGRVVRTVVDQDAAPGSFVASWDGATDRGDRAVRGVYFARLATPGGTFERKLVLE